MHVSTDGHSDLVVPVQRFLLLHPLRTDADLGEMWLLTEMADKPLKLPAVF